MPFSLPIGIELNVTADSIEVHAERKPSASKMFLMPGLPAETDWAWVLLRRNTRTFSQVPGLLAHISVGGNGVWGVNASGAS